MITAILNGTAAVNLKVGETIVVGDLAIGAPDEIDGFVWLTSAGLFSTKFGWVKWAYPEPRAEATVDWCAPDTDPPPPDFRARIGRQRRELRRLNKSNHELRLERDVARHALEDAVNFLIQTRKEHRTMEAMLQ